MDRAQEAETMFRQNSLAKATDRPQGRMEFLNCVECGTEIPPARRAAVQGCTHCVEYAE